MGGTRTIERRRRGRRTALMNGVTRMMTTSLVVYVGAALVRRAWAILNLDVAQMIRRP